MSFICPRCGAESHHPKDEEHGYCPMCHEFTGAAAELQQPGRQWIVDLIRDQFDPRPRDYRPGDNWDDGAEAIADAILAQLPLLRTEARLERVDASLARQLARSMQLNAELQRRIKELEGRT